MLIDIVRIPERELLPIQIEIDSELNYRVMGSRAEPLVYVPKVDISKLEEPSIIDSF